MIWRRPRWSARLQPGTVADLLAEAHAPGMGGPRRQHTGRAPLAGEPDEAAVTAMSKAPASAARPFRRRPTTVIAPGPLERSWPSSWPRSLRREFRGRGDGVPHQRGVDPARSTPEAREPAARVLREKHPKPRYRKAPHVSHRRRRTPPRAAAGRAWRRRSCGVRIRRAARAGQVGSLPPSGSPAPAGADRRGVAGPRSATCRWRRCGGGPRACRRGSDRHHRRHPACGARVIGADPALAGRLKPRRPPEQTLGAIVAVLRKVARACSVC